MTAKTTLIATAAAVIAAAGANASSAQAATQCSLSAGVLEVRMTEADDSTEFNTDAGRIGCWTADSSRLPAPARRPRPRTRTPCS